MDCNMPALKQVSRSWCRLRLRRAAAVCGRLLEGWLHVQCQGMSVKPGYLMSAVGLAVGG
eukprot:6180477-Pleurochrysis_carterae.AAC.2